MLEQHAWVVARKRLFELRRRNGGWAVARVSFLGEPVTMVLPPQGSGHMPKALNLGHFGVERHTSDDAGIGWHEVATPVYAPQPVGKPAGGVAWKLIQVWSIERGCGSASGTVWAGTCPAGCSARAMAANRGN